MKQIIFKSIKISNFSGISNLKMAFTATANEIYGDNGVGKTTLLSSITWCLFGKDIYDRIPGRTGFIINPIINDTIDENVHTIVELELNDNIFIRREYKKSRTIIKVGLCDGDGNLNYTKYTNKDYNNVLQHRIFNEEDFKALSNTKYLIGLHWQDFKAFIFNLIGIVSDEDVFEGNKLLNIKDDILLHGSELLHTQFLTTKKSISDDLKNLEIKIKTLTETQNQYVIDDDEIAELTLQKNVMTEKLSQRNVIVNSNKALNFHVSQSMRIKLELESKIISNKASINIANEKIILKEDMYKSKAFDAEKLRQDDIFKSEKEKNIWIIEHDRLVLEREKAIVDREQFSKKGKMIQQSIPKIEDNKCSDCGQILPYEVQKKHLDKLELERKVKLQDLYNNFLKYKKLVIYYDSEIITFANKIYLAIEEIKEIESMVYESIIETDAQKQIKKEIKTIRLHISKSEKLIVSLEEQYKFVLTEIDNYQNKMVDEVDDFLQSELDTITQKLAKSNVVESIKNDISKTINDRVELVASNLKNLTKINELKFFNTLKSDMIKSKCNPYFKLLNFVTSEITKEGQIVETFKISYQNIPYKNLNTAMQVKIALDLLNGIQKLKNHRIPILLDEAEKIVDMPRMNTQFIFCRVMKQSIKTIKLNKEEIV
jgi:DNA repair exonuclease SbcCD ATPase subunit